QRAIIIALEFDDILILHRRTGFSEARPVGVEREDVAFESAVVAPEVGHHRADEGADEAFFRGVEAERHDGVRHAARGHLAASFADGPETAERADHLHAADLDRRLAWLHVAIVLKLPFADELLQPLVFFLRFWCLHDALPWLAAERGG